MRRFSDGAGESEEVLVAAADDLAPKVPPVIEQFVRQLLVTNKAVALYPPSSTIPRDTAQDTVEILREALREQPDVRLVVTKTGMFHEGAPIFPHQSAFNAFAYELYARRLSDVRFHAGIEASDIISFLQVAKIPAEEIVTSGGFEARLWEHNVGTITVTEAQITLVDADHSSAEMAPPRAYSHDEIDLLLEAAASTRNRDNVTLARVIGQPEVVRDYLRETYEMEDVTVALAAVSTRFAELAQIAFEADPDDRDELMRSLAEALWELPATIRRDLLVDRVLPEARTSVSLSAVVRQMDVDDVCRMFVEGLGTGEVSREGLVRAIRNLSLISMADRDDVINAAGAAMLGAGLGRDVISDVIEGASPSRLTIRERVGAQATAERPADTIFKLMDLAPLPAIADAEDDPELEALRDEARRGITDGDVIGALVSLASMDTREVQFAATMSMLEDSLDLLIARGELDVAADAAVSLLSAAENPELEPEQQLRIQRAVQRFARPADVREIAKAMRLYKDGTAEHDSARRLLETLGPLAIPPLLEQLADEPDMSARKAMVDLLSQLANRYIPELGEHVSDQRWYFVRNVVGILGSAKSSAALSYLERTLRHPDSRVRRETIRSLSGITDRVATEMLIAALQDEDAQNVQLAARYLGASGARAAITPLEQVARGEGRGNRENGPRVEAIESLGKLGAVESLPILEALAGRRKIINPGKARELRAAAEAAINRIRTTGGAR